MQIRYFYEIEHRVHKHNAHLIPLPSDYSLKTSVSREALLTFLEEDGVILNSLSSLYYYDFILEGWIAISPQNPFITLSHCSKKIDKAKPLNSEQMDDLLLSSKSPKSDILSVNHPLS